MKRRRTDTYFVLLALTVAMSAFALPARASILTFDLLDNTNDQRPIPQNYGDNISSAGPDGVAGSYGVGNGFTPDVGLSYAALHASAATPTTGLRYYNDAVWPEMAWLYTNGADDVPSQRIFEITFTPSGNDGVVVNSFDFKDYTAYETGTHTVDWSLRAGFTVLLSGSVNIAQDSTASVTTGMVSPHFGVLTLRLHHSVGARDDIALDNVNFDQVPEPGAISLLAGACLLGLRRRR